MTAFFLVLVCAANASSNRVLADNSPARKPNVVILFIDDLGYGDTGTYGCKDIPTPNIDRLAREGVTCTASYITNPPCCPSRCALMMGMYGQRFGKYGMSRGLPIPKDKPTLAEYMRDAGYVTGQIGKWDIGTKAQGPSARGFMEVAKHPPVKRYKKPADAPKALQKKKKAKSKYICLTKDGKEAWLTDVNGDQMVEFIERNKRKPFFLYFSPEAVHSPNDEAPPRLTRRTRVKNRKRKHLAGAIVSVDDQVGKLLAVLKKHDLRKNTLIIFSSDNGPNGRENGSSAPYRGGKGGGTQQEGWVRVPTIFSYPGVIPQGNTYDGLTCTLDYFATIASLTSRPAPETSRRCERDSLPKRREDRPGSRISVLGQHRPDRCPQALSGRRPLETLASLQAEKVRLAVVRFETRPAGAQRRRRR